ncbi:MAG: ATP-binding protein, partial [Anaerolineae bacterium]|nr:ATP-binding protein [Anaerolineae bacterium]
GTPGQSPGTPGQSPGTPGQSPGTPGQSPGVPGQRSEQVWVRVADTGVGIPPEALPHLFEEFYRAPNVRASEIAGTGLGLAIVKDLVERYQGQIEVSSELGKGTTFTVTFPNYRGSDGTCASPDPAGQAADGASPE